MEASVSVSSNLVPHGTSIWPLCLPSTAGEERQALTLVFGSWKEPYANPACNVSEFYLIVTKAHVPPFASGCLCCTVPGTLFTHDQQPPRLCTSQLLIYTCRGLCALEAWLIPSWEACQQGQVLHIFAINSFLILINTRNILSQKLLINKGQNENKVISAVKSSRGVATCFGFKPSPSKALRKGACFHKHSGWFLPKILNLSKVIVLGIWGRGAYWGRICHRNLSLMSACVTQSNATLEWPRFKSICNILFSFFICSYVSNFKSFLESSVRSRYSLRKEVMPHFFQYPQKLPEGWPIVEAQ